MLLGGSCLQAPRTDMKFGKYHRSSWEGFESPGNIHPPLSLLRFDTVCQMGKTSENSDLCNDNSAIIG